MDTTPTEGDRVTYINDPQVFTCTGIARQFGWKLAVDARDSSGNAFWLLVEYCTPAA